MTWADTYREQAMIHGQLGNDAERDAYTRLAVREEARLEARRLRQIKGEAQSLIHHARAQIMDTIHEGPDGLALTGKAKGRQARWDAAATSLLKASWTLRGKDLTETIP